MTLTNMLATDTGHFDEVKVTGSQERKEMIRLIYKSDDGKLGRREN